MKEYFVWLAKFLTVIVVLFIGVPLIFGLAAAVIGAAFAGVEGIKKDPARTVAVVELQGMITDSKQILKELQKYAEEESYRGIVLRIDSPGGAVAPSQDIYAAVKRLKEKKPIVVSMGSLAASGGLYSALGASKVYAQPGTMTGSIGVILQLPNFTGITEKVGFQMITIKSGALKDAGNSFRPMTAEERAYLDRTVGEAHRAFIDAVAEGRNIPRSKVQQFADGRILLGSEAKELGIVDEFGGPYEAARAVFDLLKEPLAPGEEPILHYEKAKLEEFKELLDQRLSIPLFGRAGIGSGGAQLLYLMQ